MLLAYVLMGICTLHGNSGSQGSNSDNHNWSASWQTADCNVVWTATGDVTYTEDGKDVAKVASGAKLTVVEETNDHSRRVVFTEQSGMLDRAYRLDGAAHAWDADAARWFADLLVELDHQTGRLASIRFRQMMATGGVSAVLEDLQNAGGNARAAYITMLVDSGKLGPAGACRIADLTQGLYSDHEKADILSDIAPQIDFTSASCRDAYFGSARKIVSDYERARAVIAAIEHAPAGPSLDAFAVTALTVARELASDHEKEHVLVTFAPRCTGDSARTAYLATAKTIASDAERARALTALVREQ